MIAQEAYDRGRENGYGFAKMLRDHTEGESLHDFTKRCHEAEELEHMLLGTDDEGDGGEEISNDPELLGAFKRGLLDGYAARWRQLVRQEE